LNDTLHQLAAVLASRRATGDPQSSYSARLHGAGLDAILRKLGEEAIETLLAARQPAPPDQATHPLIHEIADLWFHCMVLLEHLDQDVGQVLDELQRRMGRSGLEEKAGRNSVPQGERT